MPNSSSISPAALRHGLHGEPGTAAEPCAGRFRCGWCAVQVHEWTELYNFSDWQKYRCPPATLAELRCRSVSGEQFSPGLRELPKRAALMQLQPAALRSGAAKGEWSGERVHNALHCGMASGRPLVLIHC